MKAEGTITITFTEEEFASILVIAKGLVVYAAQRSEVARAERFKKEFDKVSRKEYLRESFPNAPDSVIDGEQSPW